MSTGVIVILIVAFALLLLLGLYLSMTAGRLDRLHKRIDAAESALDLHLARRCAIVIEIVSSGFLDPATSTILLDAAHAARDAAGVEGAEHDTDRWLSESCLSQALAEVFEDPMEVEDVRDIPGALELWESLDGACRRVELSRRFLNDGVRACRQVRRQRLVRWFRLAGRTPWPDTVEMDDTPPLGLRVS
jgi:hypothetical protein